MKLGFNVQNYPKINSNMNKKNSNEINFGKNFGAGIEFTKPEAIRYDSLFEALEKLAGFHLGAKKVIQFDAPRVKAHYAELGIEAKSSDFMENIYKRSSLNIQKGPSIVRPVYGDDIEIQRYKDFTGATVPNKRQPGTLRAIFQWMESQRLKKLGYTEAEIEKYMNTYNAKHASDINIFKGDKTGQLQNNEREYKLHINEPLPAKQEQEIKINLGNKELSVNNPFYKGEKIDLNPGLPNSKKTPN